MKLKLFQKQDLARAALHDGLILSWDTGLGKTWAIFLWLLLKVGYEQVSSLTGEVAGPGAATPGQLDATLRRLRPRQPVLILAPGDLHAQIAEEAWARFRIRLVVLDSQDAFNRLCKRPHSAQLNLDAAGHPILPPDFYLSNYTQLTTNGVEAPPDADDFKDWPDAVKLQQYLCLPTGTHIENATELPPDKALSEFASVCHYFAWRGCLRTAITMAAKDRI